MKLATARTGGRKWSRPPKDYVTLRPWREIAGELARETSTDRVLKLSEELDEALEAQTTLAPKKPT